MAERNRPHLFITGQVEAEKYRRPPQTVEAKNNVVPANRRAHALALKTALENAEALGLAQREALAVEIEGAIPGIYVTFESFPGVNMLFERLDPRQGRLHPQLRNVTQRIVSNQVVEEATVFIPDGKLGYFLKRVQDYEESSDTEQPRNRDLFDRVQAIGLASLTRLWTDSPDEYPQTDDPVWWEVWLRRRDGEEVQRLRAFAEGRSIEVGARTLAFTDRVVILVHASRTQLATALDVLDDLAELRKPRSPAEFIALEPAADQATWVADVSARMSPADGDSPRACVVDTGVDRGHALLAPSLDPGDCHKCDPAWNIEDHSGHGTEMAGLALFGDLGEVLSSSGPVNLRHRLESVKLLPPAGQNPPDLWGAITATAVSLVEIQSPHRHRVFSVSITSDGAQADGSRQVVTGQPSAWSAAVDALAAGLTIETTADGMVFLDEENAASARLFVVSAGNVDDFQDDFLDRCDLEPIEEPAQAWNALTVGAYTELTHLDPGEPGYDGYTPLAPHGELSPYSRTSVACSTLWPPKPDLLLEGGNVARSPDGTTYDWPYAFQRLTTKRRFPDPRPLTSIVRETP